jgi:hypothetical protein
MHFLGYHQIRVKGNFLPFYVKVISDFSSLSYTGLQPISGFHATPRMLCPLAQ